MTLRFVIVIAMIPEIIQRGLNQYLGEFLPRPAEETQVSISNPVMRLNLVIVIGTPGIPKTVAPLAQVFDFPFPLLECWFPCSACL